MILISIPLSIFGVYKPYQIQITKEKKVEAINTEWKSNNYDTVITLSTQYLQEYPDSSNIYVLRGFALFTLAFLSSNDTTEIDTTLIWKSVYDIRRALVLGLDKDLEKSAYYILGKNYYLISGKYLHDSISYLDKSIEHTFIPNDIYEFLSSAYIDLGELDMAIKTLKEGLQNNKMLSLYLKLIDIYLDIENTNEAKKMILEARAITYTEIEKLSLQIREARIETKNNNLDVSINLFSSIIELYPESVEAHYYLGNAYEKQGNKSKARYEWRTAYKLSPYWNEVIAKLNQE